MFMLKNYKVLAGRARRGDNPISPEPAVQTIQFLHIIRFILFHFVRSANKLSADYVTAIGARPSAATIIGI